MPLWYTAVAVAVLSMSWGGPLFVLLSEEPYLAVFWRLTCTSLMMLPGFVHDLYIEPVETRERWRHSLPTLLATGVVLGFHFDAFSSSLAHTSFSSAMLLIATTPMLLVIWAIFIFVVWKVRLHSLGKAAAQGGDKASGLSNQDALQNGDTWTQKSLELVVTEKPDSKATQSATTLADVLVVAGARTPPGSSPPAPDACSLSDKVANGPQDLTSRADMQHTTAVEIASNNSAIQGRTIPMDAAVVAVVTASPSSPGKAEPFLTRLLRACAYQKDSDGNPAKPTKYEVLGAMVAFGGICVLILAKSDASKSTERPQTFLGDMLSLSAACAYAVSLVVGSSLRKWMPLWMFSFPVFTTAALTSSAVAWSIESANFVDYFRWLTDARLFGLTVAIAFIPGILGHTLANMALRRINPLVLSVALLLQPLIGGGYGYALGIQNVPGLSAILAAPVILLGIAMVVLGSRQGLEMLKKWHCKMPAHHVDLHPHWPPRFHFH